MTKNKVILFTRDLGMVILFLILSPILLMYLCLTGKWKEFWEEVKKEVA
jgi:hypothetical protein